jgi:hypothetical protein
MGILELFLIPYLMLNDAAAAAALAISSSKAANSAAAAAALTASASALRSFSLARCFARLSACHRKGRGYAHSSACHRIEKMP